MLNQLKTRKMLVIFQKSYETAGSQAWEAKETRDVPCCGIM